jgi:hypothetical protein
MGVVALHCAGRDGRAPHPGAIRQARDRAARDGRTIDPHAAQGERRRRDPGDLRLLDPGLSAAAFPPRRLSRTTRGSAASLGAIKYAEPMYIIMFVALIIFFCFFYVSIIFNPNEAADNMRKYGGFIPGIRPGRSTSDYMNTDPHADHLRRRHLPVDSVPDSEHHDLGNPSAAPAADRRFHRSAFAPALPAERPER